jgi:hypothetical protein
LPLAVRERDLAFGEGDANDHGKISVIAWVLSAGGFGGVLFTLAQTPFGVASSSMDKTVSI